jgi:hypothetical protein
MKLKNKTQITKEELVTILDFHNAAKQLLDSLSGEFTCSMEEAAKLQNLKHKVEEIFDFAPKKHDGQPMYWGDYVLKSDKDAFFTDYKLGLMKEENK